jgi:hypothetical protein
MAPGIAIRTVMVNARVQIKQYLFIIHSFHNGRITAPLLRFGMGVPKNAGQTTENESTPQTASMTSNSPYYSYTKQAYSL